MKTNDVVIVICVAYVMCKIQWNNNENNEIMIILMIVVMTND